MSSDGMAEKTMDTGVGSNVTNARSGEVAPLLVDMSTWPSMYQGVASTEYLTNLLHADH